MVAEILLLLLLHMLLGIIGYSASMIDCEFQVKFSSINETSKSRMEQYYLDCRSSICKDYFLSVAIFCEKANVSNPDLFS